MIRPVVVTGAGLVTACGRGLEAVVRAVAAGRSGLTDDAAADRPPWMRWAGRVADGEPGAGIEARLRGEARFLNRGGRLALAAAADAVADAGIPEEAPAERRALYLATGDLTNLDCGRLRQAVLAGARDDRSEHDLARTIATAIRSGYPNFLLETLVNNPYSALAAAFDLRGGGTTLAAHSPAGSQALELAWRGVRAARSDLALVVACGCWLHDPALAEMAGLGLLSRCRSGAASYRPFDARRDGFIAGEGAAALVLEPEDAARRRGARVLARIRGAGGSAEPLDGLAPGDGIVARAMGLALESAAVDPGDLGLVCGHGSGTLRGDRAELRSVSTLLDGAAAEVPVCALKPFTGHLGAASDLVDLMVAVTAAGAGTAPATLNFTVAEAEHARLALSARPQAVRRGLVLSASYGLGGQASAVVVEAPAAR